MVAGLLTMTKCSICMSQNNQQGALNWLAGQVRVLLKRVEMLEFEKEREKVGKGADTKSVELAHRLGPFESNAAPIPVNKYVASAPVIEYAPAPDVYAAPAPVNESVASSPVIEYVTPTPVQCPQLQLIERTVEIPDFLLCQGTHTAESSEIAPVRHVSFAETVEVVEFEPHHSAVPVLPDPVVQGVAYAAPAKYNAPASTMAYRVHVAPAPVTEYDFPAPNMTYRVHAAPAPEVTPYQAQHCISGSWVCSACT